MLMAEVVLFIAAFGVIAGAGGTVVIRDPFYPFGTGQMLDVAHMLVHADHMTTPKRLDQALDAVTTCAARALRVSDYGVAPGSRADLVILPVSTAHEAIRTRPIPTHVLKRGRLVGTAAPHGT